MDVNLSGIRDLYRTHLWTFEGQSGRMNASESARRTDSMSCLRCVLLLWKHDPWGKIQQTNAT
jgi:hypothetical protein